MENQCSDERPAEKRIRSPIIAVYMLRYLRLIVLMTAFCTCSIAHSQPRPEVIYHVFQRSFFDSNNDGQGDLEGIRRKLDYLQELGVTSILLTPLYVSEFYHNYFADNFETIDPAYGSLTTYLQLVREVHKRKMKIYQDVEMQYVAGKHPWFTGSYQNPGSPFSRYIYYNDSLNRQPFWFWGLQELTLYNNVKQRIVVVNMQEPAVKKYTYDVLAYWVDPNKDGLFDDGVDGFRLDHMMDDLDDAGKLPHLFSSFWTPLLSDLKKINPGIRIVAEQSNWNSYGYEYFNEGNVDRVFAFRLKFAIESFDKKKIIAAADSTFRYLAAGKEQVVFLENHDTKRFASLDEQNPGKLKAGAALNLLLGGIPAIYYGQEIGMKGSKLNGPTDGNDIPVREAFDWYTAGTGTGMAFWYKNTGPWWNNTNTRPNDGISLEEERQDPRSLWNYYQQLIRLRQSHPALTAGVYQALYNDNDQVLSFLRSSPDEIILVAVNLSGKPQHVILQPDKSARPLTGLPGNISSKSDKNKLIIDLPAYSTGLWRVD